jgi:UDP:flavonoid glycosyltransferase YjiC (YdhE family)
MKQTLKEQLAGKKILVATISADGHFNPLTGLAKYLQDAGCDVRWYTSGIYKKKLDTIGIPHYPLVSAQNLNGTNIDELYPERKLITDVGAKANFDMVRFAELSTGFLKDIRRIRQAFNFDTVISDSLFSAIPLIKAILKVPVIAIGVIPLAEESKDTAPYGPGLLPPSNDEEYTAYGQMWQLFNTVILKESIDVYADILKGHGVAPGKSYLFDTLIKKADLYLQIGTPSFEYKRSDLSANIRFIGALLPYSNPRQQQRWFDERLKQYKKVILVTQGTIETDTTKIIEPTLDAFKNTDTLVIATTGGNNTKQLQEKYPFENLIIEDYVCFDDVMPYASVYITNGGYGGTLLSISYGLPMVTAGLHEGKSEICARVGYFNYGINLNTETPSSKAIKDAAEQVLTNNIYKQNITRLAAEMEAYDAKKLCAGYIVEQLDNYKTVSLTPARPVNIY